MIILFFIASCVYSMAGFGGGPAYVALMALGGIPLEEIPPVSFLCNLIVVTGGAINFVRQGHFSWPFFWPFIVSAIPMSFLGACLPIPREVFMLPMGLCLLYMAVNLIFFDRLVIQDHLAKPPPRLAGLVIGGGLGLFSGVLGIGGGIILSPLLMYFQWGTTKQIAAVTAVFALATCLAGLSGCLSSRLDLADLQTYGPLFLAVLLGSQLGSRLGAGELSARWVKAVTVILVTSVGLQLLMHAYLTTGSPASVAEQPQSKQKEIPREL